MLRIRLNRRGSHGQPFYRVVVSDSRLPPKSRVVDTLGHHDPKGGRKLATIDVVRYDHWVSCGAQPSGTVASLVARERARAAV